jgi:serine/threonine protein kinase
MQGRLIADRYEIVRALGRGGVAEVWLARDQVLGRDVAIKVLGGFHANDPSFVERFRREARAAAALNHPHVVEVFDWGTTNGTYFMVMEYVAGPNLKEVLHERGPLPEHEVIRIGVQVASALEAAHAHGLVHRDVKPHNILLAGDGNAKVTDFGIAFAEGEARLTESHTVLGTAQYISPEQATSQPLDHRTDIYSLGVVLYELLCGQVPFDGDSPVAVALRHVGEEPQPPRALNPEVSPAMERVVLRALAKEPQDRFVSAGEMQAALLAIPESSEAAEEAIPPTASVLPPAPRPPREERTRATVLSSVGARDGWPLILAGGLAAMTALLVLVNGAGWFGTSVAPPSSTIDRGLTAVPTLGPTNPVPAVAAITRAPESRPSESGISRPTAAAAPASASAPEAPQPTSAAPDQAVAQFYQLLNNGQADRALGLWSARLQRDYPPNENLFARFRDTCSLDLRRAEVVSIDQAGGRATVSIDLVETRQGGGTARWVGLWYLVRDGQTWLLDAPALREG